VEGTVPSQFVDRVKRKSEWAKEIFRVDGSVEKEG